MAFSLESRLTKPIRRTQFGSFTKRICGNGFLSALEIAKRSFRVPRAPLAGSQISWRSVVQTIMEPTNLGLCHPNLIVKLWFQRTSRPMALARKINKLLLGTNQIEINISISLCFSSFRDSFFRALKINHDHIWLLWYLQTVATRVSQYFGEDVWLIFPR